MSRYIGVRPWRCTASWGPLPTRSRCVLRQQRRLLGCTAGVAPSHPISGAGRGCSNSRAKVQASKEGGVDLGGVDKANEEPSLKETRQQARASNSQMARQQPSSLEVLCALPDAHGTVR